MPEMVYQQLDVCEMLDILRTSPLVLVGVCNCDIPYMTPMCFQLEMDSLTPVVHLACEAKGRRLAMLRDNPAACLFFMRAHCTGTDTVLAQGQASLLPLPGGMHVAVRVRTLSGRRVFHAPFTWS